MTVNETLLTSVQFTDLSTGFSAVKLSQDLVQKLQTPDFIGVRPADSNLFKHFIIYKVDYSEVLDTQNTVELFDLTRFPNPTDVTLDKCFITIIKPLELSKVLLSISSEVYNLLKDYKSNQLFAALNQQFGLDLIHEGDLFTMGKVLLTEPINQGFLSQNTVITLVKDDLKEKIQVEPKPIDLSSFLINPSELTEQEFKVKVLEEKINVDENVGYATASVFAKLGILTDNYVEVDFQSSTKLIKLVIIKEPNTFENDSIYLSPIFIYSIGSPGTIKVKKTKKILKDIPIATKVKLLQFVSPFGSKKYPMMLINNEIQNFIKFFPRIVSINDLIPITFDSILAKSLLKMPLNEEIPIPRGNPDSIVWFKVGEINGNKRENENQQFLIDSNFTEILAENDPSLTEHPSSLIGYDKYLGLPDFFNFIDTEKDFKISKQVLKLIKSSLLKKLKTNILLSSMNRNVGKLFMIENVCKYLGINYTLIDGYDVLNNTSEAKTIGLLKGRLDDIVYQSPTVVVLKHIEALVFKNSNETSESNKLIEVIREYCNQGSVVIATTNDIESLPDTLRSTFKFEFEYFVPTEFERFKIFQYYLKEMNLSLDLSISTLSLQTAGLTPKDICNIVKSAKYQSIKRLKDFSTKHNLNMNEILIYSPITLSPHDFIESINEARDKFSDSIGAPKIPNVSWDDIGGLDIVKDEIYDTIELPLKNSELFANGLKKRSGILFYGPPGTGKTLLAKAIATNFQLNFFSVKGPELLNMYIGESEANVRKVFQKARDSKPCVIFFDELDSVAPKRGNQGDSGGVMDRIVSQLLAELDGMSDGENSEGVFVVGATNRPDLLDEALLRPGRFDKMVYLGIADDDSKQLKILEALTRKFKLDEDVDLQEIVKECGYNFTGADFYALCSDSMLNSMIRVANECDIKIAKSGKNSRYWFDNIATEKDIQVLVKQQDFVKARDELNPSVSVEELQHYLRVRENFEGGKKQKE